jgi:Holliday junction resolvase RusA-like endonuclease
MRLVILGLSPSTNNLYTVVRARQVVTETGRRFHAAVGAIAARAWTAAPGPGPFAVLVTYHLGAYDRDVDGSHKALLDGLSGVVWQDDRQVVLFAARKRRVGRDVLPYVSLVVRPLTGRPLFVAPTVPTRALGFATTIIPPSANNTYTTTSRFRRKTVAARSSSETFTAGFTALMAHRPPLTGPLRVRLRYGFTADRRDVDGSHKLLLDAARGRLWLDDRQIVAFTVSKARLGPPGRAPRIEGAVWALEETSA